MSLDDRLDEAMRSLRGRLLAGEEIEAGEFDAVAEEQEDEPGPRVIERRGVILGPLDLVRAVRMMRLRMRKR